MCLVSKSLYLYEALEEEISVYNSPLTASWTVSIIISNFLQTPAIFNTYHVTLIGLLMNIINSAH